MPTRAPRPTMQGRPRYLYGSSSHMFLPPDHHHHDCPLHRNPSPQPTVCRPPIAHTAPAAAGRSAHAAGVCTTPGSTARGAQHTCYPAKQRSTSYPLCQPPFKAYPTADPHFVDVRICHIPSHRAPLVTTTSKVLATVPGTLTHTALTPAVQRRTGAAQSDRP